jgi:tRNA(Ile)-lysidine synthase
VDRVAVAHTADDQAETVLMHLLRGTGLTGLGGIHPVLGRVVRPLLRIPRSDLRAYLTERGEAWCEDVSNADTSRLRARIRHRLLPLLAAEFEPAAAEHLAALAELAREDDAVLAALAEEACRGRIRWSEGRAHVAAADLLAPTAPLTAVPAALAGRMVRHVAAEVLGYRPRFSRRHVADVLHLARGAGKRVELPGMTVVLQSGELCFAVAGQESRETAPAPSSYQFVVDLAARGELDFAVPDTAQHVRVKVIDWPVPTGETRRASEALDRNLLQEPLVLRNWRPGDTYRPLGRRSAHKLKRLFGEGRVPAIERPAWPVLVAGDQLVWARRFGVAAAAAAGPKTRTAVLVSEEKA